MKKNIITVVALATMMLIGGVSSAQQYALHFREASAPAIEPNSTVEYTTEDWEEELGMAAISFIIENLTDSPLMTVQEVTMLEGPEAMAHPEVCGGGTCPWDGQPYAVEPGMNPLLPLTLDIMTRGNVGSSVLYRIDVWEDGNRSNSISVNLRVNVGQVGIENVEITPVSVYPNPTTGKVKVGDEEFDLSDKPAGVYFLPYEGGAARVIKM